MAKKINHIKPSFIEGGEVWHDIDKFPMLDYTIGKMYDGYVYVVHYNFASTAS